MCISPPCLGKTALNFYGGCTVLALLFSFTCITEAQTFNVLEDDFTRVTVDGRLPRRTSSSSSPHRSVADEVTIGGATAFDFSATAAPIYPAGEMDASGFADFGVLKAKINFSGPSAILASVRSDFNDIFTVSPPPGVAPGTPGALSFVYFVDGIGDATGLPGETPTEDFSVATVGMLVVKTVSDGSNPPSPVLALQESDFFEVIGSQSLGGGVVNQVDFSFARLISFDVPFEYGVPFALRTQLAIVVETDNDFIRALFNPYREIWGGGVIENIFVDIFNTAKLTAIVNETNPEAEVHGVSLDYSPLVTDTFPMIPEPDSLWLLTLALAVLVAKRSRGVK